MATSERPGGSGTSSAGGLGTVAGPSSGPGPGGPAGDRLTREGPGPAQVAGAGHKGKNLVLRVGAVVVAGVALYVLLPSLTVVLGAWPRLSMLNLLWLAPAAVAEAGSFTCTFALQRLVLRTRAWFAVATAGITGNAVTNVLPGGDAA